MFLVCLVQWFVEHGAMDIWTGDLTKKERDTCFVLGPAGRMAASGVFKLANVARRRQRNIYRNVIRKKIQYII